MSKVHASLFSGFGGADLAAHWAGWENAFWCEIDGFCQQVLRYWFPQSKGYENIKETDFTPWRGKVDVLTGGFPCQPFSVAGQRKGAADDRYLWPEMLRAIREIRPTWVIGENVAGILSMVQPGCEITVESQASLFEEADKETLLDEEYVVETVCRDLEQEGYSVQPVVIPACAVGAPHRRDRVWFVANRVASYADCNGNDRFSGNSNWQKKDEKNGKKLQCEIARFSSERIVAFSRQAPRMRVDSHANGQRFKERHPLSQPAKPGFGDRLSSAHRCSWREFPTQSPVCRGNDGLPFDVVRLTLSLNKWKEGSIKGYGNAIVPQVIYEIFKAIETIQVPKKTTSSMDEKLEIAAASQYPAHTIPWISVEEKLPAENEGVFFVVEWVDHGKGYFVGLYENGYWESDHRIFLSNSQIGKVTHWMPIPLL